jgi:phage gpG-like protein
MAITVEQWQRGIGKMSAGYNKAILGAFRAGLLLGARAARDKFIARRSGPPLSDKLTHRSGALGRSIKHVEPRKSGNDFVGGLTANTPYARIHELGGRTGPHVILPRSGSFLRFEVSGRVVFVRRVNHPGSNIPARPYLAPALEEVTAPEVQKQVKVAVETLAAKSLRG